jgi:hypothetical protein
MANPSYGSIASTSTRATTSTVPPPSTSSARRAIHNPSSVNSSPQSTMRTPRRQRLHRPSIMSLSEQPRPSTPRTLLPTSASGSGSGSGPSLGSPYSQTLRHRQSRRTIEGEDLGDNWASLRDMVSEDENENADEYEERNDASDTSTLRPVNRRSTEPSQARSIASGTSVRSFFTARSSIRSERSGITIRNGSSPSDAILSSSPPQMNGFGNMEEVMESEDEGRSAAGSCSTVKGQGSMKNDIGDERQPLLQGMDKSLRPTQPGELFVPSAVRQ